MEVPKIDGWFISWKIPPRNGWWLGVPYFRKAPFTMDWCRFSGPRSTTRSAYGRIPHDPIATRQAPAILHQETAAGRLWSKPIWCMDSSYTGCLWIWCSILFLASIGCTTLFLGSILVFNMFSIYIYTYGFSRGLSKNAVPLKPLVNHPLLLLE